MNWLEKLRDEAQRPPAQPRMPLLWNGQVIGTVAQGFLDTVGGGHAPDLPQAGGLLLGDHDALAQQAVHPDRIQKTL